MTNNKREDFELYFHQLVFALCNIGLDDGTKVWSHDGTLTGGSYHKYRNDFINKHVYTNTK